MIGLALKKYPQVTLPAVFDYTDAKTQKGAIYTRNATAVPQFGHSGLDLWIPSSDDEDYTTAESQFPGTFGDASWKRRSMKDLLGGMKDFTVEELEVFHFE